MNKNTMWIFFLLTIGISLHYSFVLLRQTGSSIAAVCMVIHIAALITVAVCYFIDRRINKK